MRARLNVGAAGLCLFGLLLFLTTVGEHDRGAGAGVDAAVPGGRQVARGGGGSAGYGLREKLERRWAIGATESFRLWMETGMGDLATGIALARERRVAMGWLIENDPEAALERAIDYGGRKQLAAEIIGLMEEPVSDAAAFEWLMACPLEGGGGADVGESRWLTLESDGRRFEAFVFGRRLEVGTKDRISVHGVALDGKMAVAEHPVRRMGREEVSDVFGDSGAVIGAEVFGVPKALASEEDLAGEMGGLESEEGLPGPAVAESPWTEGAKRILYIRVRFSDDAADAEPLSFESAESRQSDVGEFFRLTSYGKVTVETEITDVVTLPDTHASYGGQGLGRMMDDARAGAIVLGGEDGKDWDYRNYDFYTVVSRGGIGGYAGIAQVGGRKAHLQSTSLRTAGHEYGHNFGLGHAYYNYTAALRPTGQTAVHGERPLVEYGHRFSIQSAQSGGDFNNPALPQFTAHEKNRLDWLTDADFVDVDGAAGAGLYRVFRNDHVSAAGLQALRLPARSEGTSNRRYWVSYRAAWAPPARSSENTYLTNGAVIDWTRDSGSYSTLLDLTPYSDDGPHRSGAAWTRDNDDKWDAALLIGRTFSDPEAGVHVTPTGRGGNSPVEFLNVYVHIDGTREEVWVAETATCRAVVPDAATAIGTEWSALGFDDSGWASAGDLGVGYENGSGYQGFIGTDVKLAMSGVRGGCYIRVPFEISDAAALTELGGLKLRLRYDDGFVAYLNGVKVAEANAPANPTWSSEATAGHPDSSADDFVDFAVGAEGTGALVVGENVLAIHGLNDGLGSSDFLIQPQLVASYATEKNTEPSVELVAERTVVARNDAVVLTAVATDPDGDQLAYAWHFGEGDAFSEAGLNSPTASKAWASDGEYVVQVTVSDRRGGVSRDQVVVQVGNGGAELGQVRGRVIAGGLPVAGVRVWSGEKQTFSAGDGSYVLAGLGGGEQAVRAMADGELFSASGGMPIAVSGVVSGVEFWAFGSDSNLADGGVLTVAPSDVSVERGVAVPLSAWWWRDDGGEQVISEFGASGWRFLDDGSDQGTGWKEVGFDDSAWATGAAPLGYGEAGLATEIDFGGAVNERSITTYFRRYVSVDALGELSRSRLRVKRDDAVVVYINGTEVLRDNIRPGETLTASREAFNEVEGSGEDEILEVGIPVELLVEGVNVIAVEVHQESPGSDDLFFDLEITGRRNVSAPVGTVWTVEPPVGASVTSEGEFLGTEAGSFLVTAEANGQTASARVAVASDQVVAVVAVDGIGMEWDSSGGVVRIERSDPSGGLDVGILVGGDAVPGADYVGLPTHVSFAEGELVIDLPVTAIDDSEAEGGETVTVSLVADGNYRLGSPGTAAIWIEDDDLDPAPVVSIVEPLVGEGERAEAVVGQAVPIAVEVIDPDMLVARQSGWRFSDDGQPPPEGWVGLDFADDDWREGAGQFGYGDGDEASIVSFGEDAGAKHITTYFRKKFELRHLGEIAGLTGRMLVDDGAVVYMNGVEVLRQNLSGGVIGPMTRAESAVGGDDEDTYFEYDLPVGALHEGGNVIAVEVHQSSPTSSDLGFDLELEAERRGALPRVALMWSTEGGVVKNPGAPATEALFDRLGAAVLRVSANDGGGGAGMAEIGVTVVGDPFSNWIAGLGVPVALRGAGADADGDGIENLVEFAMGMDGSRPDRGVPIDSMPGKDWQVRFVRRAGGVGEVGDYFAAGVHYRVWLSSDGQNWQLGGGALRLLGSEDFGEELERVTVEVDPVVAGDVSGAVLLRIEMSN